MPDLQKDREAVEWLGALLAGLRALSDRGVVRLNRIDHLGPAEAVLTLAREALEAREQAARLGASEFFTPDGKAVAFRYVNKLRDAAGIDTGSLREWVVCAREGLAMLEVIEEGKLDIGTMGSLRELLRKVRRFYAGERVGVHYVQ